MLAALVGLISFPLPWEVILYSEIKVPAIDEMVSYAFDKLGHEHRELFTELSDKIVVDVDDTAEYLDRVRGWLEGLDDSCRHYTAAVSEIRFELMCPSNKSRRGKSNKRTSYDRLCEMALFNAVHIASVFEPNKSLYDEITPGIWEGLTHDNFLKQSEEAAAKVGFGLGAKHLATPMMGLIGVPDLGDRLEKFDSTIGKLDEYCLYVIQNSQSLFRAVIKQGQVEVAQKLYVLAVANLCAVLRGLNSEQE